MADIVTFQKKLGDMEMLASINGKKLTSEAVRLFFKDEDLNEDQLKMICDYLKSRGIRMDHEKVSTTEPDTAKNNLPKELVELTFEEREYLAEYEDSIRDLQEDEEIVQELFSRLLQGDEEAKERLTAYYLPEVVKAAKELHTMPVFIGDMIQEGNISLMAALKSCSVIEQAHEYVCRQIRQGILELLKSQQQQKQSDEFLVERVQTLEKAVKELTDEIGEKFSIEELSAFLDMEAEEIRSILKLTGDDQ